MSDRSQAKHQRTKGIDINVDTSREPRVPGHLFYHPAGGGETKGLGGCLLNTGGWIGDAMMQAAPWNRFVSAVALTVGLKLGTTASVALTGLDYDGTVRNKEAPLFHNPGGDALKDRRIQFLQRFLIPAITGAAMVVAASRFYLWTKQHNDADVKDPKYLEDYATATVRAQAKPWGWLSAITSLFPSASGSSFLPFNYGVAVNTQSAMESGQRMMLPGVGKIYSNNRSTLAGGTAELQKFLIRYAAGNPSLHPARLEDIWSALILPLFPKATPEQLQQLVDKTHTLRDPYMKRMMEGENAKTVQKEMTETFTRHFTKEGFLQLLTEAGLDPAQAEFVNNGLSGKVGNVLGAGDKVRHLQAAYVHKVHDWQAKHSPVIENTDIPSTRITGAEHLAQQSREQTTLFH